MMLFLKYDSILYFIQYMLLRAYTGTITNIISFFRVLIFSNKDKMIMKHKNIAYISDSGIYHIFMAR